MQRIFRGQFRIAYLVVKAQALYAGTFFICYYWPKFLNYIIDPPPLPALETLALLPPVGFLILGACLGKRVFLAHLALLMVAGPVAYLVSSGDDGAEALVSHWVIVILVAYAIGWVAGVREQLLKHKPELED